MINLGDIKDKALKNAVMVGLLLWLGLSTYEMLQRIHLNRNKLVEPPAE